MFDYHPETRGWPASQYYLHAAVIAGIGIQIAAASMPFTSDLLGNAAIPVELWGVVFGGALLAWGLAEAFVRLAWRRRSLRGTRQ